MISIDEVRNLYESELIDQLKGLEDKRKKVRNIYLLAILAVIGCISNYYHHELNGNPSIAQYVFFAVPVLLYFHGKGKKDHYTEIYKREVVSKIVSVFNSEWTYYAHKSISPEEYYASDLFRKSYDRYKGDDLITGTIDKTNFRCSELHTEYKTTTTDSKGRTRTQWHTIFKGLFFHADFNKHFSGKTYVTPDFMENWLGKLGQKFQNIGGKGKLVKLENPEFEKLFVVHSTDQQEARYILTPKIMEALVNLKREHGRDIHISFVENRVYCAFLFSDELFEPRIFSSGVNFDDIEKMYDLISINHQIIQELNLNTRIWTKE